MQDLTLKSDSTLDSLELRMGDISIEGAASFTAKDGTRYIMCKSSEPLVPLAPHDHLGMIRQGHLWIPIPEPDRRFRTLDEAGIHVRAISGFAHMMWDCYDLDIFERMGARSSNPDIDEISRQTLRKEELITQELAELRQDYAAVLATVRPLQEVGLLKYLDMTARQIHEKLKEGNISIPFWNQLLCRYIDFQ